MLESLVEGFGLLYFTHILVTLTLKLQKSGKKTLKTHLIPACDFEEILVLA